MKQLTFVQTRDMLLHVADQVIDSKAFLTEIDSKIGDGDHGIGMERGMKKAKEKLLPMENGDNVFSLFQEMGKTMLMSMGGASGVIFGTLFMGGAKGKTASSLTASGLISLMEDSLRSIQDRGKAQTGDKTMVDALVPAVDSMKNSGTDDLEELLSAAAESARQGMEATKNYQAKYGRAKSLQERSIGYQDAGATSTWIIFRAMAEYVQNL